MSRAIRWVENKASVLENKWKKIPERNTKLTSRKFILGEKENSPNIIRNNKENNPTLEMEIKTKERLYTNSAINLKFQLNRWLFVSIYVTNWLEKNIKHE